jgi:hypothetical protein
MKKEQPEARTEAHPGLNYVSPSVYVESLTLEWYLGM